jgi:outer membrane protein assembly factor BamB
MLKFGAIILLIISGVAPVCARDQPQWGEAWTRNMVSKEKHLPASFDPVSGKNIKWKAELGTQTYSTPVVANGRVYIGTNNERPRDPKHHGDRGVLMCLDEKTGKLLWQLVVPKRDEDAYMDWPRTGMASEATVEGERVYIVDNRDVVLCLDAKGFSNGNEGPFRGEGTYMTASGEAARQQVGAETRPQSLKGTSNPMQPGPTDADIVWQFDMPANAGVWPHDAAHSSILIDGDYLYLNTASGVDNTHKRIRAPDAPSLIVLDKRTGQWVARDDEHISPDIFHNAWSSPSMGIANGRKLIFYCGGNGVVYGFEPLSRSVATNSLPRHLKKVFQFDFDPEAPHENIHTFISNRQRGPSNLYGMPVFYNNRLYVAGGGDLWWGKNQAWLKCIDATKTGNITTNGLIWSYALQKHVLGTPAATGGMVFIADCGRTFHCVDAQSGKALWTHSIEGEVWASPLVADGKVYLGTREGTFYVFAARREKKLLSEIEFGSPISATATAANGVLYVATMSELFAISEPKSLTSQTGQTSLTHPRDR